MWTYVVMIVLVVLIALFFILAYNTKNKNISNAKANIFYPFSGYLAPPKQLSPNLSQTNPGTQKSPQKGLYLVGQVGGENSNIPQIQCPTGYKINIVGAFVEVTDPYGECSTVPDPTLQLTCGNTDIQSDVYCNNTDTPCGQGMTCNAFNRCTPLTCYNSKNCGSNSANSIPACPVNLGTNCAINSDCDSNMVCIGGKCTLSPGAGTCMSCIDENGNPIDEDDQKDGAGPGTCAFMPTCSGVNPKGYNKVCNVELNSVADDKYQCRPREATAYLAKHCDGKNVCLGNANDIWDPNQVGSLNPFGPLPCRLAATDDEESNMFNADYLGLPIISGWGGGVPTNSDPSSSKPSPATFNQGYYVHGIYTCVPDDEFIASS